MLIELVFTNLPQQYSLPLSYKNTSVQVKWLSPTNSVTRAPPGTNLRLAIGYRLLRYSTAMQPFVFQTGGHSPPIYLLICSYPKPKYISRVANIEASTYLRTSCNSHYAYPCEQWNNNAYQFYP